MKKKLFLFGGIGAAVVIAAVVLILTLGKKGYRSILVIEISGNVNVTRDGKSIEAYPQMKLRSGDGMVVSGGGYARLKLDDDKYVFLEENTIISLEAAGTAKKSRTIVYIEQGKMLTEIRKKLSSDSSYDIVTPNTTMAIRGTATITNVKQANADPSKKIDEYNGEENTPGDGNSENFVLCWITDNYVIEGQTLLTIYNTEGPDILYRNKLLSAGNGVQVITPVTQTAGTIYVRNCQVEDTKVFWGERNFRKDTGTGAVRMETSDGNDLWIVPIGKKYAVMIFPKHLDPKDAQGANGPLPPEYVQEVINWLNEQSENPDPTPTPSAEPTTEPTVEPTTEPTVEPTPTPTTEPTPEPTAEPTPEPNQGNGGKTNNNNNNNPKNTNNNPPQQGNNNTDPNQGNTGNPQTGDNPNGGDVDPNGDNVDPNGGDVDPNGGNDDPNGGDVDPNGGNDDPNGGDVDPNGGDVDPNGGNDDPNGGNDNPNGGTIDPNGGTIDPNGGKINPNGGTIDPNGGNDNPNGGNDDENGGNTDPNGGNDDPNGGNTTDNKVIVHYVDPLFPANSTDVEVAVGEEYWRPSTFGTGTTYCMFYGWSTTERGEPDFCDPDSPVDTSAAGDQYFYAVWGIEGVKNIVFGDQSEDEALHHSFIYYYGYSDREIFASDDLDLDADHYRFNGWTHNGVAITTMPRTISTTELFTLDANLDVGFTVYYWDADEYDLHDTQFISGKSTTPIDPGTYNYDGWQDANNPDHIFRAGDILIPEMDVYTISLHGYYD